MPEHFEAVLVKGRGNYLSLRRLRVAQQRSMTLFADRQAADQLHADRQVVAARPRTAAKSDLEFRPPPSVWDAGRERHGNCLGRECPELRQVLLLQGPPRHRGGAAAHRQSRPVLQRPGAAPQGGGLLPDYKVVIFDEAHTLEDVAADHLGLQVSQGSLEYFFNKLALAAAGTKACSQRTATPKPINQLESDRQAAEWFFQSVRCLAGPPGPRGNGPRPRTGHRAERAFRGIDETGEPPDALCQKLKSERGARSKLTSAAETCARLFDVDHAMARPGPRRPGLLGRNARRAAEPNRAGQRADRRWARSAESSFTRKCRPSS